MTKFMVNGVAVKSESAKDGVLRPNYTKSASEFKKEDMPILNNLGDVL